MNQDGSVNGPSNPAPAGSVVSLWGTGFGLTDPPCITGNMNSPGAVNLAANLTVLLNDLTQSYSPLYAGNAPGLPCGIQQINFVVPAAAQPGPRGSSRSPG